MTTSQDWWPADYGHYGPLFIRMSWHAAGTYRIEDGRGGGGDGAQRFAPLNSWPDNANLDKARRLLWPVKQKYGQKISWADLLVFAGNCALESMGFKTFGFGFGREDIWEPEEIFWGPEDTWLGDERYSGDRELAGPARRRADGPDLRQPRGPERRARPAGGGPRHPGDVPPDGDERRGDRRADRRRPHASARPTAPARPTTTSARSRRPPRSRQQGLGWKSTLRHRQGRDAITSGLEVAWTPTPTQWDNSFFENLFGYEWELTKSPAGAWQWVAKDGAARARSRTPHDPSERTPPTMLTTDLALRVDPAYEQISPALPGAPRRVRRRVRQGLVQAAAPRHGAGLALPRARGSPSRSCGRTRCPRSTTSWSATRTSPRSRRRSSPPGCRSPQLVATAWASAASFRGTDKRGGANGARIRLEPQRSWEVNEPAELAQGAGDARAGSSRTSTASRRQADLAGRPDRAGRLRGRRAGGARTPGTRSTVPFAPGRTDASQEQTDVESFAVLEPRADGFRNYLRAGEKLPPETLLLDRANLLTLTAPEMTVLVGGLRALGANVGERRARRLHRPARHADQRLLRQPARQRHRVEGVGVGGERLRGPRPRHRRGQVDGHRRRPRLRLELPAARARRGLRERRRAGEVRA